MQQELIDRAIAAIDAVNRNDPNVAVVRGRSGPKELLHAELVTEWIRRLEPAASAELLVAGRAHHLRRWERPRDSYPKTRSGYLDWRRGLQKLHADATRELLDGLGWPPDSSSRVGDLIRKRGLGSDPEVQVLEDALCLVFFELQLGAFAASEAPEKAERVLKRTLSKMSDAGRSAARELTLDPAARRLLDDAIARR